VLKFILFLVISAAILFVSWSSFRNWRSHGFYRFFAFESILILFLLNGEYWFRNPFAAHHIISWLLLIFSLFLVGQGFYMLRVAGKPKGHFENTTTLVRRGAYRYIRHPLYSSLLFLGWGVYLKDLSLLGSILVLLATAFLAATAKVEEAENIQKFGEDYAAYMKTTKRFIPFLY
jgi:protein-S-isoprenylcysteine O-methyltransferase Ste14